MTMKLYEILNRKSNLVGLCSTILFNYNKYKIDFYLKNFFQRTSHWCIRFFFVFSSIYVRIIWLNRKHRIWSIYIEFTMRIFMVHLILKSHIIAIIFVFQLWAIIKWKLVPIVFVISKSGIFIILWTEMILWFAHTVVIQLVTLNSYFIMKIMTLCCIVLCKKIFRNYLISIKNL